MFWVDVYRQRAYEEGICDEYRVRWSKCHNRKSIMDMALSVRAVDYVCNSIAKGWASLCEEDIKRDFGRFINGNYARDCGGYLSEMYCGYSGEIVYRKTILTLIFCKDVKIIVPKGHIVQIYVVGEGSNITLCSEDNSGINLDEMINKMPCSYLESKAYVTTYREGVRISDDGNIRVHIANKCGKKGGYKV